MMRIMVDALAIRLLFAAVWLVTAFASISVAAELPGERFISETKTCRNVGDVSMCLYVTTEETVVSKSPLTVEYVVREISSRNSTRGDTLETSPLETAGWAAFGGASYIVAYGRDGQARLQDREGVIAGLKSRARENISAAAATNREQAFCAHSATEDAAFNANTLAKVLNLDMEAWNAQRRDRDIRRMIEVPLWLSMEAADVRQTVSASRENEITIAREFADNQSLRSGVINYISLALKTDLECASDRQAAWLIQLLIADLRSTVKTGAFEQVYSSKALLSDESVYRFEDYLRFAFIDRSAKRIEISVQRSIERRRVEPGETGNGAVGLDQNWSDDDHGLSRK